MVRLNYKEAIIKGFTLKGYTAVYSNQDQDMDRVVLPGIPEEGGGAGKQGMVLPYGQGPFCLCWGIQKMHRRDRSTEKGDVEHNDGLKGSKRNKRFMATKELHSLSKTYTLLLIKDLPFVTNLSKFYDQDMLNSNYNNYHYNQKMNIQIEITKILSRIPLKEKILTSPKI